jgi:hypothetical protein
LARRGNGVTVVSANDVWAVGAAGGNALVEHWDGTSWSTISSPNPGTASNALFGVTSLSDGTVVAVGSQTNQGTDETPLILHS